MAGSRRQTHVGFLFTDYTEKMALAIRLCRGIISDYSAKNKENSRKRGLTPLIHLWFVIDATGKRFGC